jgi:hypothetical protein
MQMGVLWINLVYGLGRTYRISNFTFWAKSLAHSLTKNPLRWFRNIWGAAQSKPDNVTLYLRQPTNDPTKGVLFCFPFLVKYARVTSGRLGASRQKSTIAFLFSYLNLLLSSSTSKLSAPAPPESTL